MCSTVYSEIRKHGLLMTSLLEAYGSNTSENLLIETDDNLRSVLRNSVKFLEEIARTFHG